MMDASALRAVTSSARHDWQTPWSFFSAVERLFLERYGRPFDLDAAASPENAKAARFFTEKDNGLLQTWRGFVWLNPPYGAEIGEWVKKAAIESEEQGAVVAVLVPARTDTRWFTAWAVRAAEMRFISGRLQFELAHGAGSTGAPFPSVLLIFDRQVITQRVFFWNPKNNNLEFEFCKGDT